MRNPLFLVLATLLNVAPVEATTWHVPEEAPTIQAGIDAADHGDTVLVADGHYFERIRFWGKRRRARVARDVIG
jgi:hypothetical protein